MRIRALALAVVVASACLVASDIRHAPPASAANNLPHEATGGFARPDGLGFWITYTNGDVRTFGTAGNFGNASTLALKAEVLGGAVHPSGTGYWLLGSDGGIFSYGDARFHGSTGD